MARLNAATLKFAIFTSLCLYSPSLEAKSKAKPKAVTQVNFNSLIIKRNYKAAFAALQSQANRGDSSAAFRLAEMYRLGLGTSKDYNTARNWLVKAASAGNNKASALLQRLDQNQVAATIKKTTGGDTPSLALANVSADFSKLPRRPVGQPDWLTLAAARKNADVIAGFTKFDGTTKADFALLAAVKIGDLTTSKSLVAQKITGIADSRGQTPLMLAVGSGNAELTNIVLQGKKTDFTAKDLRGKTAVDIAAQNCQPAILAKLIENGASVEEKESPVQPLILITQNCKNWPEFKPFFKAANVNASDSLGRTAAWYAAAKGDASLLALLADSGADLALADKDGFTPLHAAAANKQPFSVRYILSKLDSADKFSARGTSPLMLAAASGCDECVSPLIEKSSDMNSKNMDGDNALIFAVRSRQGELAALLIEKGGNADARNGSGDNANKLAELIGLTILKGSTQ
jgi:ankyrin repeat protein